MERRVRRCCTLRILPTLVGAGLAYAAGAFAVSRVLSTRASARLRSLPTRTVHLPSGDMTYLDQGDADVAVLVAHGITGGYDQALDTINDHVRGVRILAPSRFGYPGSPLPTDGSPAAQATAFAELVRHLGLSSVFIVGASAGGAPAIRFALDHPELTRGLILFCSAPPCAAPPARVDAYQGPPRAILNDFLFTLFAPLFPMTMGMPPVVATISMPLAERLRGIENDARVTNPDMARHFADYPIESISEPVLILHARDDTVAKYDLMAAGAPRFAQARFVTFETGGHLMSGNEERIASELAAFFREH